MSKKFEKYVNDFNALPISEHHSSVWRDYQQIVFMN